jgi:hypothetical protein
MTAITKSDRSLIREKEKKKAPQAQASTQGAGARMPASGRAKPPYPTSPTVTAVGG